MCHRWHTFAKQKCVAKWISYKDQAQTHPGYILRFDFSISDRPARSRQRSRPEHLTSIRGVTSVSSAPNQNGVVCKLLILLLLNTLIYSQADPISGHLTHLTHGTWRCSSWASIWPLTSHNSPRQADAWKLAPRRLKPWMLNININNSHLMLLRQPLQRLSCVDLHLNVMLREWIVTIVGVTPLSNTLWAMLVTYE